MLVQTLSLPPPLLGAPLPPLPPPPQPSCFRTTTGLAGTAGSFTILGASGAMGSCSPYLHHQGAKSTPNDWAPLYEVQTKVPPKSA